jgi:RNA polymerase sigma-70 factor (ECF subfamily)
VAGTPARQQQAEAPLRHADPRDELVSHLPAMRAFALSLTRNASQADDLVQDTVVKAWSHFDRFAPGTNLRAWLFTILRNTFYSTRAAPCARCSTATAPSWAPGREARARRPLQYADFVRAFQQLPDEQREALAWWARSGHSYEEAAEMTGRRRRHRQEPRQPRPRAPRAAPQPHEGDRLELTDRATLAVIAAQGGPHL